MNTTHSLRTDAQAPIADAKPYAAPELQPLGSISGLTAGSDTGTIDQLFGGNGGFGDPDPTS